MCCDLKNKPQHTKRKAPIKSYLIEKEKPFLELADRALADLAAGADLAALLDAVDLPAEEECLAAAP